MNKQADFGSDLATLNENVTASVGDVLQALQQKRVVSRPGDTKKAEAKAGDSTESTNQAAEPEPSAAVDAPRRQRSANRSRLALTVERDEPLENVTTRLRHKTNELLTEAALRQRLKKTEPSTRQDIVESALQDWFRKNGYALGRERVGED